MDNITQAFIKARKASGLTQKELAAKAGVDQADISKLERGTTNPTISMLNRLAQAMDMQLNIDFICEKETKAKDKEYLEIRLPQYLKNDIEALEDGRKRKVSVLDCLYNEVQSSINTAYYDGVIDGAQADYLRSKYL